MDIEPFIDKSQFSGSSAPGSHEWIWGQIQPYIKGNVMEIGSRTGSFASFMVEKELSDLILTDPQKANRDILRSKFNGINAVKYVDNIDCDRSDFQETYASILGTIDTIAALNIAENGFYSDQALQNAKRLLRTRGHLIVVVPSRTVLFPGVELTLADLKKYNKQSTFNWLENVEILRATYFYSPEISTLSGLSTSALILLAIRKL